jgi:hypothetical protein
MKATQEGFTEVEVLRSLHGCIYGVYPLGVLYLLPTMDEVSDFSQTRFNPLIEDNPDTIGIHIQNTNRVNLKKVGTAFLYFRGGRIAANVEGGLAKTSAKLKSIPVDHAVMDEIDEMSPGVESMAAGRMQHSKVKTMAFLGNPILPNRGIAAKFAESDQRAWMIPCYACRTWTWLDAPGFFPECFHRLPDNTVQRVCMSCGREIDPRLGEWVAAFPSRSAYHTGFHIGQPSCPYSDPTQLLNDFEAATKYGGVPKANFHRLRLGRPYFDPIELGTFFHTELTQAEAEGRLMPHISEEIAVPVDTWWDIGMDDSTAIWFSQTVGREIRFIHYYESSGVGLAHYARELRRLAEENRWSYGRHTGPHDFSVREFGSGKTRLQQARENGLNMTAVPRPQDKGVSIQAARDIFSRCWFDRERCERGIEALRMYRREYDENNKAFRSTPAHDWASHGSDSFQTCALGHDRGVIGSLGSVSGKVRKLFGG